MFLLVLSSCFVLAIDTGNSSTIGHNITDYLQKRKYYGGSTATNIAIMNSNNAALMDSSSCETTYCM